MQLETQAAISGLAIAAGIAILLQQFGVWPLTVVTLVVAPLAAAGAGLVVVRGRKQQSGGDS